MASLRRWWRGAFDVREGEYGRTVFTALYFFFILCAVHTLKPVATALFLDRFPVHALPHLYVLIAAVGGVLAYLNTKLAVRISLYAAVAGSTLVMTLCLAGFWYLIGTDSTPLFYAFAIWVNLFGILFISQGWLIAANLFDGREAKRLYGLVGLGAVLGGATGGTITMALAKRLGSEELMPIGIGLIVLAFFSLRVAARSAKKHSGLSPSERFRQRRTSLDEDDGRADFSVRDVVLAIGRHRHLLVIVGIILATYLVEVLVEFQFSVQAKAAYTGDELTAFLGKFNGVYMSVVTFVLQLFFTNFAVGRLGVGRTLLISPLSVGVGALSAIGFPGLKTAAFTRLAEGSTRYSISRTALELLYLPLPTEVKNRTKSFIDVFVDRLGRGAAAILLIALLALGWQGPRQLSVLILVFAVIWVLLAVQARQEYTTTVRQRVESRRFDLEDARITVQDTETVRLLEQAARGSNTRQVIYVLSVLAEAPNYRLPPLLDELSRSKSPVVRAKLYQLARKARHAGLLEQALAEIGGCTAEDSDVIHEAACYVVAVSPSPEKRAAEFIAHPDCRAGEAALSQLAGNRERVRRLISREWLVAESKSKLPQRRALAAYAVGVRGDEGTDALHCLLKDPERKVVEKACHAAGRLGHPDYLPEVVRLLVNPHLRGAALEALINFGEGACETFAEILRDNAAAVTIRRQIPRVLAGIVSQKSVSILTNSLGDPDLTVRGAVLKGLSKLRLAAPDLDYADTEVRERFRSEASSYFELYAALERFRKTTPGGKATALLARTIDNRLSQTIERLFRLLALRYPPKQIHAAYLAVHRRRSEEFGAALEFLDNILDRDLKNILLPMIDGSPHLLDIGKENFGIEVPKLEAALRQQIRPDDVWLSGCAIAAAGELRLRSVAGEIRALAEGADDVLAAVARSTLRALT